MNLKSLPISLLAAVFLLFVAYPALSQGTAFMYQGQLGSNNIPANGTYIFTFTLYPAAQTNGVVAIGSVTNSHVVVNNGLFTTTVDFGPNVFTGQDLWMQIGLGAEGGTNFTVLQGLQPVLPAPYAIFASSASTLTGELPASQLSGTLPASAFAGYTNTVALTNGANLFAGTFSGNGLGVTNVSTTNLLGVLADSQLPNNTAFLNSNETFTTGNTINFNGANTFTNLYGNSFSGSFFGNGLVGWIVVPGTTTNASIDTGYLLTNSQLVTVYLPASPHAGDVVRIACAGASGWQLAQTGTQYILGNFSSYGQAWYLSGTAGANDWTAIASSADGTKMVATAYGGTAGDIYTSDNSGQTWGGVGPTTPAAWQGCASSADGTKMYAAIYNNDIYYSSNSGASSTWAIFAPAPATTWTSLACSSDGTHLVGGTAADYIYTFVGGAEQTPYKAAVPILSVASSANGTYLLGAGFGGNVYLSNNSGTSFGSVSPSGGSANWDAVAMSADGSKMYAAASNGLIYVSYNFGSSWSATKALSEPWVSIASSSDGSKLVAVAAKVGIYTSSNAGNTWTLQTYDNATPGANWSCAASAANGNVLAAGINNTLTSSTYGIFTSQAGTQTQTTTGSSGYITGAQGSSVELQCIGNNNWMPVSFTGTIWAQ